MRETKKGLFRPKNPSKYLGNPTNIVYRSGWEKRLMEYLDTHSDVLQWSSEETIIPYRCPVTGRIRRYFPDVKVRLRTTNGLVETRIIEVKPFKETQVPKRGAKYNQRVQTFAVNQAKWEAARQYCENHQYKFQILTEHNLFDKRRK